MVEGQGWFGFHQLQKNYSNEENVSIMWGQKKYQQFFESYYYIKKSTDFLAVQGILYLTYYLNPGRFPPKHHVQCLGKPSTRDLEARIGGFFAESFFKLKKCWH